MKGTHDGNPLPPGNAGAGLLNGRGPVPFNSMSSAARNIPCTLNGDGTITLTGTVPIELPMGMKPLILQPGFVSDGRSGPILASLILGPKLSSPYDIAWLLHDYYCSLSQDWAERTVADGLLAWKLREMGAHPVQVWLTYLLCLTFGRVKFLRSNGW